MGVTFLGFLIFKLDKTSCFFPLICLEFANRVGLTAAMCFGECYLALSQKSPVV